MSPVERRLSRRGAGADPGRHPVCLCLPTSAPTRSRRSSSDRCVELVAVARGRAAGRRPRPRPRAHRRPRLDSSRARTGRRGGRAVPPGRRLLAEPIPEVTRVLARLRIEGSVLEGVELADLHRVLVAARRRPRRSPSGRAEQRRSPRRSRSRSPTSAIERRLEQSVDPDGTLLDTASPALAAARREVHAARNRLIRRLESLLRGLDAGAAPAEATVTVRGGRYVIPVRRDSRSRPAGIMHDESGSAGTLFVEPSDAIELGNALTEAEVEEERETLRVLRELTDLLRPELAVLRGAVEMCVAVDDLVARARYAVAVEGEVPEVSPAPASLLIVNGRHPLLIAGGDPVVPFDLEMPADERTLLISGPNTGGKTVLLKAVGLAAALAQSRDRPSDRRGQPAAGVHPLLRRHRRPAVDRRQPLHLQRPCRDAAADPRRGGRGDARAARRGGERHRPGGRRGARRGHARLPHLTRGAHLGHHASRGAQEPRLARRVAW